MTGKLGKGADLAGRGHWGQSMTGDPWALHVDTPPQGQGVVSRVGEGGSKGLRGEVKNEVQ